MSILRDILAVAHSGLRWVALLLLLFAIINAFRSMNSGQYTDKTKKLNLFAMVVLHLQFVIGLGLMFVSGKVNYSEGWMKIPMWRFFGMEHILMMLIAIVVVTIGRSKTKRLTGSRDKHKRIAIWYTIALIIILAAIPWPFRAELAGGWIGID